MNPGVYTMPSEEYHALPALSSGLAQTIIQRSPLHAWTESRALNPAFREVEKEAFDIGSGAHALLLEGEDRMVVVDADDWRTKKAREDRDAAREAGKHPVLARRYADIVKMRDVAEVAIRNCEELGLPNGLRGGLSERVIIWTDPVSGAQGRARPDWWSEDGSLLFDYKSTTDATPAAFSRQIARMGYHYQAQHYSEGAGALKPPTRRPISFVFGAQETTPPYAMSFHACAPSLLFIAARDLAWARMTWIDCLRTGQWPSHSNRIHYAEAEGWQVTESEALEAYVAEARPSDKPLIGLDHEGDPL